MVSLTYFPQKHEFKVFIFLLDETGMAQNNSLFLWKTSNYNRGRSNLRNGMNQETNLQPLGFTQERVSKFTRGFSWGSFIHQRLPWFSWCSFWPPYFFSRPFCGRPYCKTSIICIRRWSRWFPSTKPRKLTIFSSLPSTSYIGEQSF